MVADHGFVFTGPSSHAFAQKYPFQAKHPEVTGSEQRTNGAC
jgi:hypothetical protein